MAHKPISLDLLNECSDIIENRINFSGLYRYQIRVDDFIVVAMCNKVYSLYKFDGETLLDAFVLTTHRKNNINFYEKGIELSSLVNANGKFIFDHITPEEKMPMISSNLNVEIPSESFLVKPKNKLFWEEVNDIVYNTLHKNENKIVQLRFDWYIIVTDGDKIYCAMKTDRDWNYLDGFVLCVPDNISHTVSRYDDRVSVFDYILENSGGGDDGTTIFSYDFRKNDKWFFVS